jgi:hypothetical protein
MPVSELDRVARVEPWLADQGWLNREFAEIIRFNWPSQEAPVRISERPTMRLALDEPNRVPQPFRSAGARTFPAPRHTTRAQARQRAPPLEEKKRLADE